MMNVLLIIPLLGTVAVFAFVAIILKLVEQALDDIANSERDNTK